MKIINHQVVSSSWVHPSSSPFYQVTQIYYSTLQLYMYISILGETTNDIFIYYLKENSFDFLIHI